MSQSLRQLPNLETQYDGPPPPSTLRSALFDVPAFAYSQRNAEAIKAVQAIAKRRSHTQTPKSNDLLDVLADDLRRLRVKAILQLR